MKNKVFAALICAAFVSCNKEANNNVLAPISSSSSNEQRNMKRERQTLEERITNATKYPNPDRVLVAKNLLTQVYPNASTHGIYERIVVNPLNRNSTFAFVIPTPTGYDVQPYGTWVLYNDGCFYHGQMDMDIFIPDANPNTDDYIGNEPMCDYAEVIDQIFAPAHIEDNLHL